MESYFIREDDASLSVFFQGIHHIVKELPNW